MNYLTLVADTQAIAHKGQATSCSFSGSGSLVATCGSDELCKVWDVESGARGSLYRFMTPSAASVKSTLYGASSSLTNVAFSANDTLYGGHWVQYVFIMLQCRVMASGAEKNAWVWSVKSEGLVVSDHPHSNTYILCFAAHAGGPHCQNPSRLLLNGLRKSCMSSCCVCAFIVERCSRLLVRTTAL